jgi:hypothetical protein
MFLLVFVLSFSFFTSFMLSVGIVFLAVPAPAGGGNLLKKRAARSF